eukprot:SAG11_NODE_4_length_33019_cov_28.098909_25_plen_71_part_00
MLVQKILNFPRFCEARGECAERCVWRRDADLEKNDEVGRLQQRFTLTFDSRAHVKAGKEDKLRNDALLSP